MRNATIHYLVVHCSDTPNEREVTAADIHDWHQQDGWDGIGYHAVIHRNGMLERGRPHYWIGAHVRKHNQGSLGICLIGRDQFTDEQISTLKRLLVEWSDLYPLAEIIGHRDLNKGKTCPNFDVRHWWHTGDIRP